MKKLFPAMLAAAVIIALAAAGCGEPVAENGDNGANGEPAGEQRIISLMPSKTEKLFALGLGEMVVGITDRCDFPEEIQDQDITRVGDAFSLSLETIVSLTPDLVVANWLPGELLEQLQDLGISVYLYDPASIDGVFESITQLGELTGRQEAAAQLVAQMKTDLDLLLAQVGEISEDEKVRVLYLLDEFLFTAGKGTLQDELITLAGGINVIEEAGWPQINKEVVISCDPDVILYTFPGGEEFLNNPDWQSLDSVGEGRVHKLDESLASRTGPRIIQGLQQIFSVLYPDR